TMRKIDKEIRRILDDQYSIAYRILQENADKMEVMCNALMEWETLDADQVKEIMAGKQPSPPKDYSRNVRPEDHDSTDKTEPSEGQVSPQETTATSSIEDKTETKD
ncbi:MAG: hypothetical protein Q4P30_06185, partial [Eubacteriales bacterium]|nr:hypothetical protein [Eubacteriales bacterium]